MRSFGRKIRPVLDRHSGVPAVSALCRAQGAVQLALQRRAVRGCEQFHVIYFDVLFFLVSTSPRTLNTLRLYG